MAAKKKQGTGKITVSENGPYIVSGNIPLAEQVIATDRDGFSEEWRKGQDYSHGEGYALCRCGKSKAKPFCDGNHAKAKFKGRETASRLPYERQASAIEGPNLTLLDAPDLCAFARFCDRGEGVWSYTRASGEKEARDAAVEEACKCPSGRLVAVDRETGEHLEPNLEPSIGVVEDPKMGVSGPLWVRGGITIESADGKPYEARNRVTLCRCGKSGTKPFCDGSHAN